VNDATARDATGGEMLRRRMILEQVAPSHEHLLQKFGLREA
jgi:hypothetical protein